MDKPDERLEKAEKDQMTVGSMVIPPPEEEEAPQSDGYPDPIIWTHVMSFLKNASTTLYWIDTYRAAPQFPPWQPCYGRRFVDKLQFFELQEVADQSFAGIESDLRYYALEARKWQ
ncbi:hypothetical protein PRIC2_004563 [Phytophthora ramorum]